MSRVVLLLGSNIENRAALLSNAREQISSHIGLVITSSSIYESKPWGFESKNSFLNQAVLVETDKTPENTLKKCLEIEKKLGRVRKNDENYSDRNIDIDILLFNELTVKTPELQIPHPRMHERRFCMEPLNEIVTNWNVPTFNKTVGELAQLCNDSSKIDIFDVKI